MAVTLLLLLYCAPAALVVGLMVKVASLFRRRRRLQTMLKDFPGPRPHWLFGNNKDLTGDYAGMLRAAELATSYQGAVAMWTGPWDCSLLAVHPTVAKALFSGTDPKDEFSYSLLRGWLGDGLLLSNGGKWNRTRRMLTPAFSVDLLRSYVSTFRETSAELVEKWRGLEGPVEVFHHIGLMTVDSMLRCLFGHRSGCQQERERHPYVEGVHTLSHLIVQRILNPLHHWDCLYYLSSPGRKYVKTCEEIHRFSGSLVSHRRQALQSTELANSGPVDFLDILLTAKDPDGHGLTDQEIKDEVDTFMFGGHDSTASALSWCLHSLAAHPKYQELCRQEIHRVLKGRHDVTWDDLGQLQHTTRCLYESMRLYPPVPNLSRFTERDISLPDGRVVPKGIRVGVSLFAIHRNPNIWQDPQEFYPERFESDEMSSANFFMPFSLGPRNCIGQHFALTQLRVALSTILRSFRLTLVASRPAEPVSMLILRSKDGLFLQLEAIN